MHYILKEQMHDQSGLILGFLMQFDKYLYLYCWGPVKNSSNHMGLVEEKHLNHTHSGIGIAEV